MSKVTLNDVTSGFASSTAVNANNTVVELAFENTLSRDGTGPNHMNANLDMNGYMVINQANPITVEGFNWEGEWTTGILYEVGDLIEHDSSSYIAIVEHTSGTFATDLAALKWQTVASSSGLPSQAGSSGKVLTTDGVTATWSSVGDVYTPPLLGTSPGTTPVYSVGGNVLYEYNAPASSDNVLTTSGTRGGLFADYDCVGSKVYIAHFDENQAGTAGGGFRDLMSLDTVDTDTTNYTAIGQKVTNGIRSFVQGEYSGGAFQSMYKDLVGGYFAASGNIAWEPRGVSAITCDAYQYGVGIASNEFAVHNPAPADGGVAQSKSMAAVQAIIRSRYADEDFTHTSRGVYISNNGKRITNAVEVLSDTSEGYTSHYKFGLNMKNSTVSGAAIVMPKSASSDSGTVIEYDTNDYTVYDRDEDRFYYVINTAVPFAVTSSGVNLGTMTAPSVPLNGDIWFDGTSLKIRIGGVTKTVTVS